MGSKVNLNNVVDRHGLRQQAGHHANRQNVVPTPTSSRHGIEEGSTASRRGNKANARVHSEKANVTFGRSPDPDQK